MLVTKIILKILEVITKIGNLSSNDFLFMVVLHSYHGIIWYIRTAVNIPIF